MIPLEERCKQEVSGTGTWGAFHRHQCNRRAVKDGYCKQHHPDSVKKRLEESEERYKQKFENSLYRRFEKLVEENKRLKIQIKLLLNERRRKGYGQKV